MQDNHEKPNSNRNNEADEGRNVRPFANGSGQRSEESCRERVCQYV